MILPGLLSRNTYRYPRYCIPDLEVKLCETREVLMPWLLQCHRYNSHQMSAETLVDLLQDHRDGQGWFLCSECGWQCYVGKHYRIAEGNDWNVKLWGALYLQNDPGQETYCARRSPGKEDAMS